MRVHRAFGMSCCSGSEKDPGQFVIGDLDVRNRLGVHQQSFVIDHILVSGHIKSDNVLHIGHLASNRQQIVETLPTHQQGLGAAFPQHERVFAGMEARIHGYEHQASPQWCEEALYCARFDLDHDADSIAALQAEAQESAGETPDALIERSVVGRPLLVDNRHVFGMQSRRSSEKVCKVQHVHRRCHLIATSASVMAGKEKCQETLRL